MAVSTVKLNNVVLMTVADTTAVASDVEHGKYFYTAAGVKTEGTNGAYTDYVDMPPITVDSYDITFNITKNHFSAIGTSSGTFLRTLQDNISCPAGTYEFNFGSLITSPNFQLQLMNVTDNTVIYGFGDTSGMYSYQFTLSTAKTLRIRTLAYSGAVVDESHDVHLYKIS